MNCVDAQRQAHWPEDAPLAPAQQAALEEHIAGCSRCQETLATLRGLDDLIATGPLSQLTPAPEEIPAVAASLERWEARLAAREQEGAAADKPQDDSLSWWQRVAAMGGMRPLAYALPAMVAVLVTWSILPFNRDGTTPDAGQAAPVRRPAPRGLWVAKGGMPPQVDLLFAAPDRSLRGFRTPKLAKAGQPLHPGDFLQLRYTMPRHTQVMVVSMNARGEIAAFHPFQGTKSMALSPGDGVLPPEGAWELDGYIGAERIYLLVALKPFGLAQVKAALMTLFRKAGRQTLPRCRALQGPWWCRSFGLQKQVRKP